MAIRGNTMARYIQPLCHSTGVFQTDGQKSTDGRNCYSIIAHRIQK